jgi:hypothetical protein
VHRQRHEAAKKKDNEFSLDPATILHL